jgi:ribosomal-protein-alanine N-acetyltransferase
MDGLFPIHTERLILREMCASDEPDIHAYASDPEVARLKVWGPNTPEMTRTFLVQALEAQKISPAHPGTRDRIEKREPNDWRNRHADQRRSEPHGRHRLGAQPKLLGTGYVSQAARAMLRLGFSRHFILGKQTARVSA